MICLFFFPSVSLFSSHVLLHIHSEFRKSSFSRQNDVQVCLKPIRQTSETILLDLFPVSPHRVFIRFLLIFWVCKRPVLRQGKVDYKIDLKHTLILLQYGCLIACVAFSRGHILQFQQLVDCE